jgi:peptide/nickel transport system substrate-binding protein
LRSKNHRCLALLLTGSLVAAACSGTGGGAGDEPGDESREAGGTDADAEVGPPQAGGSLVYGLEAETTDGWCLPEARLAISGIQVVRSMYDTLTVPDGDENFQPHLAESVEPNEDFTQWTITVREGVTFHDGSELTAEVVKNNLDAYRGARPPRSPDLFIFVFQDIESVEVTGPREVTVSMKRPWVSFDGFLYSSGRLGMMAQSQLDAEGQACRQQPIGTGPFMLEQWRPNESLTLTRNPNYWRTDENGEQLPYLEQLEYRPIPEVQQRVNGLQSGELDAFHATSDDGGTLLEARDQADAGQINLVESDDFSEVSHLMLNSGQPPFDNKLARQAVALAVDNARINEVVRRGLPELANGPFAPGAIGHLDDTGYPTEPDPERARQLAEQYEQETGEELTFRINSTPVPEIVQIVQLVQEDLANIGIETSTATFEQSALIEQAITGDFQMSTWRNYPGLDPDGLYVWWHSQSPDGSPNPVNFPRINDSEVDRLLDEGRVTGDREQREQIYQDLNRRLAEELYMLWGAWTIWAVPSATDVHGVVGARPVGTDGSEDYTGLALGHDPALLWREQ